MGQPGGLGLGAPTLVLNKSWVPINTITVRHALVLVVSGSARIIQPDTYEAHDFESWCDLGPLSGLSAIHTPRLVLRSPEVIVLTTYNKIPGRRVPFSRRNLHRRDGDSCQYCGRHVRANDVTVDHVVPRSHGGANSWENCVIACRRCNSTKGNKRLKESGLHLRREPVQPEWSPCITTRKGHRHPSWRGFVNDRQWASGFGT
ncbi:MAG: 5-methylcytosine-specific restriction endonuclease McrA [Planctomycetota bacterium]|jgi:5-methylcytosine-specific restriction endonuclease McrA